MNSSDNQALRRIWADATQLSKYVEARAETLAREAPPARDRKTRRTRQLSTLEYMALASEYDGKLHIARDKAQKATINDLIAGRIVGLGRRPGSYVFEAIKPSFWIGADVAGDAVTRDGVEIIEVRMVQPDAIPVDQVEAKRASPEDLICAAITEYLKKDPRLSRPPAERYRAYRSYISKQGRDPRRERGFGDKNLERYEGKFRSKFT
ncbi:MAG: hypothetical protein JO184_01700 [Gammaproteobacteria bacterium]|nr:hypothetical protein [Gammaproteobacteria bacterium]